MFIHDNDIKHHFIIVEVPSAYDRQMSPIVLAEIAERIMTDINGNMGTSYTIFINVGNQLK